MKKFNKLSYLLLVPFVAGSMLTSCDKKTSSSTDGGGDGDQTGPLTSVTYMVNAAMFSAPATMTDIWMWNSTENYSGSFYLKDVFDTTKTESVNEIDFYKGTLTIGDKYQSHGDWGLADPAVEITVTEELLNGSGMLIRSPAGAPQTSDFPMIDYASCSGDAVVYILDSAHCYYTADRNQWDIEFETEVPDQLTKFDLYFYCKDEKLQDTMQYLYFFSYGAKKMITIKPTWTVMQVTNNEGDNFRLLKTTLEIGKEYDGVVGWNYEEPAKVTLDRDLLTGKVLIRDKDGKHRSSDIGFDYNKVLNTTQDNPMVIYGLPTDASWNNGEFTHTVGDSYYSFAEFTEAINVNEGE